MGNGLCTQEMGHHFKKSKKTRQQVRSTEGTSGGRLPVWKGCRTWHVWAHLASKGPVKIKKKKKKEFPFKWNSHLHMQGQQPALVSVFPLLLSSKWFFLCIYPSFWKIQSLPQLSLQSACLSNGPIRKPLEKLKIIKKKMWKKLLTVHKKVGFYRTGTPVSSVGRFHFFTEHGLFEWITTSKEGPVHENTIILGRWHCDHGHLLRQKAKVTLTESNLGSQVETWAVSYKDTSQKRMESFKELRAMWPEKHTAIAYKQVAQP